MKTTKNFKLLILVLQSTTDYKIGQIEISKYIKTDKCVNIYSIDENKIRRKVFYHLNLCSLIESIGFSAYCNIDASDNIYMKVF